MGSTKYSRNTRNKSTLHTSIQSSPRYGSNACNLCERGRYPDDLSLKVSKYKTCADVHLELSLIDPSTATCAAGQEAYREICCPTNRFELPSMKFPAVSVAAGLFLFWIFTRKVRQVHKSPDNEDEADDDLNGRDEEVGDEKKYQRMMDDQSNGSKRRKRSKSRERNVVQQRGRSKSRERNLQRSRSKESKWSKSTSASKSTLSAKGSHEDAVPDMVNMTFMNAKKGKTKQQIIARASGASNVLQQQQRRLQKQYYGAATKQKGGAIHQLQEQESEDAYYHLDDDTDYGDSTLGGHDTVAGDSIQAVITQVL